MSYADNISWGIELETTIPNTAPVSVGRYHNGRRVEGMGGWKAESDSSIHTIRGRKGCEFVSPILRGQSGIESLRTAVGQINDLGAKVNHTCGVHVTVSWNGDASALARLITLVANYEQAIWASTGTHRRENSPACKKIKCYGNHKTAKDAADQDRYHMLNLTHLAWGYSRIEFRAFSGSLNADKLVAWVMTCLGLVEVAMRSTRRTSWDTDASRGPWARSGRGQREGGIGEIEIRRLFYRLGWTKGHTEYTAGQVGDEDVKTAKKALLEMAQKYDAQG